MKKGLIIGVLLVVASLIVFMRLPSESTSTVATSPNTVIEQCSPSWELIQLLEADPDTPVNITPLGEDQNAYLWSVVSPDTPITFSRSTADFCAPMLVVPVEAVEMSAPAPCSVPFRVPEMQTSPGYATEKQMG